MNALLILLGITSLYTLGLCLVAAIGYAIDHWAQRQADRLTIHRRLNSTRNRR